LPFPLKITTGNRCSSGVLRMNSSTFNPLSPGMTISRTIRSGHRTECKRSTFNRVRRYDLAFSAESVTCHANGTLACLQAVWNNTWSSVLSLMCNTSKVGCGPGGGVEGCGFGESAPFTLNQKICRLQSPRKGSCLILSEKPAGYNP
jgi:hypothetical protein